MGALAVGLKGLRLKPKGNSRTPFLRRGVCGNKAYEAGERSDSRPAYIIHVWDLSREARPRRGRSLAFAGGIKASQERGEVGWFGERSPGGEWRVCSGFPNCGDPLPFSSPTADRGSAFAAGENPPAGDGCQKRGAERYAALTC